MDFRKCTALLLSLLMLVSNAGLAFNVHYCAGKMASVSSVFSSGKACAMEIVKVEKPCCAKKIELEHKKCCKDKVVNFKSKSQQSVIKAFSFEISAPYIIRDFAAAVVFKTPASFKKLPVSGYYCDANAPPLYRLYSQFLLYA